MIFRRVVTSYPELVVKVVIKDPGIRSCSRRADCSKQEEGSTLEGGERVSKRIGSDSSYDERDEQFHGQKVVELEFTDQTLKINQGFMK